MKKIPVSALQFQSVHTFAEIHGTLDQVLWKIMNIVESFFGSF